MLYNFRGLNTSPRNGYMNLRIKPLLIKLLCGLLSGCAGLWLNKNEKNGALATLNTKGDQSPHLSRSFSPVIEAVKRKLGKCEPRFRPLEKRPAQIEKDRKRLMA